MNRFALLALVALASQASLADDAHKVEVLFVGDSHGQGNFGKELLVEVTQNPDALKKHTMVRYAVSNANAMNWVADKGGQNVQCFGGGLSEGDGVLTIKTWKRKGNMCAAVPKLETLIERHDPKVVVIELGSNQMGYDENFTLVPTQEILAILKTKLPDSKCVWIGAPDRSYRGVKRTPAKGQKTVAEVGMGKDLLNLNIKEVNTLLDKTVSSQCIFVNSLAELESEGLVYPESKGEHYDKSTPGHLKYRKRWVEIAHDAIDRAFDEIAAAARGPSSKKPLPLVKPIR